MSSSVNWKAFILENESSAANQRFSLKTLIRFLSGWIFLFLFSDWVGLCAFSTAGVNDILAVNFLWLAHPQKVSIMSNVKAHRKSQNIIPYVIKKYASSTPCIFYIYEVLCRVTFRSGPRNESISAFYIWANSQDSNTNCGGTSTLSSVVSHSHTAELLKFGNNYN